MRILMVSHAFLPHSWGGVEVCTAYTAQALQQLGHQVRIFHRVAQPNRPEYELQESSWEGLPVTTINNTFARVNRFEMAYRNEAIEAVFAGWLERLGPHKPDVVHFQHLTCLSTGLPLVVRQSGIPTLLTLHDYWMACQRGQMLQPDLAHCTEPENAKCAACLAPHIPPRRRIGRALAWMDADRRAPVVRRVGKLARRFYPDSASQSDRRQAVREIQRRSRHVQQVMGTVDQLITPSEYHRMQFIRFGVPAERIVVRNNGLHTEPFRDRPHVPADHVRFLFLGSVIPSKGVHVLVEAFRELGDEHATLDIYGWAPPYEGFPSYLQDLKDGANSQVRFRGPYENRQVASILAESDVIVVPSIWPETAGLTIQEARIAGIPAIASRIGGIPEFVQDEVSGLLFTPGSVSELRAQMQRFADDPRLVERLRDGIQPVKTIEEHALELESLYRQWVGGEPQ